MQGEKRQVLCDEIKLIVTQTNDEDGLTQLINVKKVENSGFTVILKVEQIEFADMLNL